MEENDLLVKIQKRIGRIDVKKREESEKISFKELQPLEMGEKWCFGAKKDGLGHMSFSK